MTFCLLFSRSFWKIAVFVGSRMFFDGLFCHFWHRVFWKICLIALFSRKNVLENFFIVKFSFSLLLEFLIWKKIFNFRCFIKNQIDLTEKKKPSWHQNTNLELLWYLEGSLFSYQINMFFMITYKKKIQIPSISFRTKNFKPSNFFLSSDIFLIFQIIKRTDFFKKLDDEICF